MDIEQPGAGSDREADAILAQQPVIEVFGERDPADRSGDRGPVGCLNPTEFRRPETRVEETAGTAVGGAPGQSRAEAAGFRGAPRIGPDEYLRGPTAARVDTHQAWQAARRRGGD